VLLARHARERVAHWEKKPPRESSTSWSGRGKGGVGILIGWLSGANKSAKASKSRPEITTKSRGETSMGSCELSRDSSKDGGRDCAAKKPREKGGFLSSNWFLLPTLLPPRGFKNKLSLHCMDSQGETNTKSRGGKGSTFGRNKFSPGEMEIPNRPNQETLSSGEIGLRRRRMGLEPKSPKPGTGRSREGAPCPEQLTAGG
jgi:hypothetical protein